MRSFGLSVGGFFLTFGLTAGAAFGQPDVSSLSISSRDSENLVEWRNPTGSGYEFTRIIARADRFAADADDSSDATLVVDAYGEKGEPDSLPHGPLVNGVAYFYTAHVRYDGSFSSGVPLGSAVDTSGAIRWVFRAGDGATAMSASMSSRRRTTVASTRSSAAPPEEPCRPPTSTFKPRRRSSIGRR